MGPFLSLFTSIGIYVLWFTLMHLLVHSSNGLCSSILVISKMAFLTSSLANTWHSFSSSASIQYLQFLQFTRTNVSYFDSFFFSLFFFPSSLLSISPSNGIVVFSLVLLFSVIKELCLCSLIYCCCCSAIFPSDESDESSRELGSVDRLMPGVIAFSPSDISNYFSGVLSFIGFENPKNMCLLFLFVESFVKLLWSLIHPALKCLKFYRALRRLCLSHIQIFFSHRILYRLGILMRMSVTSLLSAVIASICFYHMVLFILLLTWILAGLSRILLLLWLECTELRRCLVAI